MDRLNRQCRERRPFSIILIREFWRAPGHDDWLFLSHNAILFHEEHKTRCILGGR